MKKSFLILFALSFIISCNWRRIETGDQNSSNQDHLIMSTLWFQHSAEMRASFYQAFNLAEIMLNRHLEVLPANSKPAIVIDIDETVLDNSPFQGQVIFDSKPYTQPFWEEWTSLSIAETLPGALEFLNLAKEKGVEVFYVTNRKETEREATLKNLVEQGLPFAENKYLILRTEESSKESRRKKIAETYTILLLIGDNLNDFAEVFENRNENNGFAAVDEFKKEFGRRFIILPNPMYGEWERPFYNEIENLNESEKAKARKRKLAGFR
jgi:5'-nucleotidase (lipoprotein e(P4) family)